VIAKKHIARLKQIIRRAEEYEAHLQEQYGDPLKGSGRSSDLLDAATLRAVLAALTPKEAE